MDLPLKTKRFTILMSFQCLNIYYKALIYSMVIYGFLLPERWHCNKVGNVTRQHPTERRDQLEREF